MARITIPVYQHHEPNGAVASAAKLYFYENRTEPPVFKPIYSDSEMSIGMTNPVTLGDDGYTPDIFGDGVYTIVAIDQDGSQLWSRDDVVISSSGGQYSDWSPVEDYALNSIVRAGDGNYYVSLLQGNIGQDPLDWPQYWSQVAFLRYWNQFESYRENDIVLHNGGAWTSKIDDNLNNEPSSGSEFWQLPFTIDVVGIMFSSLRAGAPWLSWRREGTFIYLDADLAQVIGVPGGAASLDGSGKVPASQLDIGGTTIYRGTWNASTNTPALPAPATGNTGWYYVVTTAGTHLGIAYNVGDWAISNGSAWQRIAQQPQLQLVSGPTDNRADRAVNPTWDFFGNVSRSGATDSRTNPGVDLDAIPFGQKHLVTSTVNPGTYPAAGSWCTWIDRTSAGAGTYGIQHLITLSGLLPLTGRAFFRLLPFSVYGYDWTALGGGSGGSSASSFFETATVLPPPVRSEESLVSGNVYRVTKNLDFSTANIFTGFSSRVQSALPSGAQVPLGMTATNGFRLRFNITGLPTDNAQEMVKYLWWGGLLCAGSGGGAIEFTLPSGWTWRWKDGTVAGSMVSPTLLNTNSTADGYREGLQFETNTARKMIFISHAGRM